MANTALLVAALLAISLCQIAVCRDETEAKLTFDPAALEIIGNQTYYISPGGSATHTEALRFCTDIGMVLLSFDTVEKFEIIKQHLFTSGQGGMEFWTSGRRWIHDTWVWTSTGQEFTFTMWYSASNEPDFRGDNDPCVTFVAQNGWYDEPIQFTAAFICQER